MDFDTFITDDFIDVEEATSTTPENEIYGLGDLDSSPTPESSFQQNDFPSHTRATQVELHGNAGRGHHDRLALNQKLNIGSPSRLAYQSGPRLGKQADRTRPTPATSPPNGVRKPTTTGVYSRKFEGLSAVLKNMQESHRQANMKVSELEELVTQMKASIKVHGTNMTKLNNDMIKLNRQVTGIQEFMKTCQEDMENTDKQPEPESNIFG